MKKIISFVTTLIAVTTAINWSEASTAVCLENMVESTTAWANYTISNDLCQVEGECCRYNHQCVSDCCDLNACRGAPDPNQICAESISDADRRNAKIGTVCREPYDDRHWILQIVTNWKMMAFIGVGIVALCLCGLCQYFIKKRQQRQ